MLSDYLEFQDRINFRGLSRVESRGSGLDPMLLRYIFLEKKEWPWVMQDSLAKAIPKEE